MPNLSRICTSALVFSLAIATSVKAEPDREVGTNNAVVGKWCDQPVPNMPSLNAILTISIGPKDGPIAHRLSADGSEATRHLKQVGLKHYSVVESASGDQYRVDKDTGDLELLDSDGLIRVAKQLTSVTGENGCGFSEARHQPN